MWFVVMFLFPCSWANYVTTTEAIRLFSWHVKDRNLNYLLGVFPSSHFEIGEEQDLRDIPPLGLLLFPLFPLSPLCPYIGFPFLQSAHGSVPEPRRLQESEVEIIYLSCPTSARDRVRDDLSFVCACSCVYVRTHVACTDWALTKM